MAKKVTFNISGNADDASNKWAIIGLSDKLCNPRLFRFVRPAGEVIPDITTEWMLPADDNLLEYKQPYAGTIECSCTDQYKDFRFVIRDADADNLKPSELNPVVIIDPGCPEYDFEVKDLPNDLGALHIKSNLKLNGLNTIHIKGRIQFTIPTTGNKIYLYFDITFKLKAVTFVVQYGHNETWNPVLMWLLHPDMGCTGAEFNWELAESLSSYESQSIELYGDGSGEYRIDIPQDTPLINAASADNYIIYDSDFCAYALLPDGTWRYAYYAAGTAFAGYPPTQINISQMP